MPLRFDCAHRLALEDVKAAMAREGRTVMNGADVAELRRLIALYTDNRPTRRGAEDEIRYSENGMDGGSMEEFCR